MQNGRCAALAPRRAPWNAVADCRVRAGLLPLAHVVRWITHASNREAHTEVVMVGKPIIEPVKVYAHDRKFTYH